MEEMTTVKPTGQRFLTGQGLSVILERLNDKPHHPWVAVQKNGTVTAAHCDCMAGLGESCSHVAALLFKIETAVRMGYTKSVSTDQLYQQNQCFTKK
ncbi:hypothetical protein HOLleu_20199 [Holothuria leucospilota]|uniref:SWIM-type domain-containing protein n=1 Tax=Holothuria leucospilota TaxID=206669 RepID=A0A9Q1BZI5_HOLLE|nr:hypothetical protein HOLleu_20199 [Holothuria leucospilota]